MLGLKHRKEKTGIKDLYNLIHSIPFYLFFQIVPICSNQAILRVECTLSTQMVKDTSMSTVTCALTVEAGPCFREDRMAQ